MAALVEVRDLRCGYGRGVRRVEVVHGVSFDLDPGEFACIIGANGCGKTTTLKTMMGLQDKLGGDVLVAGEDVFSLSDRQRAQRFAYIPQAHTPPFPFSVSDVVMMGRTPHLNRLARPADRDREASARALEVLGIENLASRIYTQLSGGQRQMVLIARALAQEAEVLVMDEPTASLDFGNQQLVLSCMRMLSDMGKAVVMVTHDPDHALYCADRVMVMEEGRCIRTGTAQECITTDMLARIYRTDARVIDIEVEPGRIERACIPVLPR
ncbi:ABC transporter ATP-binding protein [Gordonibacter sp. Marseille-P4307]|uniref:ABC transporter ATP-binding protein n=1 Tax=Gordonibacter sp. Marseille-P4307 TaxID=2161815 RepID=UPI000F523B5E|nr:ABC transporter ATP-binding protein [Gordonibacter sp. Marseille-P4307]